MSSWIDKIMRLAQAAADVTRELALEADGAGRGHYAHLAARIVKHYRALGIEVEIEPRGHNRVDLAGSGPCGRMIGEIKNAREARTGADAWWSHWSHKPNGLAGVYRGAEKGLSGVERGWCAVIDGQLRDYAGRLGLAQADLIVESHAEFSDAIRRSLRFLEQLRRIRSWTEDEDKDIGYFTVRLKT